MAEVVKKALGILEIMREKDLYPTEHLDCAKEVINSYPISKITWKEKTAYKLVAASIWLTGHFMGKEYRRSLYSIVWLVIEKKFGVQVFTDTVSGISEEMVKNSADVRETLSKINEFYGNPEIPDRLRISKYFKRS